MNLEYWRTYVDEIEATPVGALLGKASPAVRTALERALLKRELTPDLADYFDIRASSFLCHSCFVIHTSILPKSTSANFDVSNSAKLRL